MSNFFLKPVIMFLIFLFFFFYTRQRGLLGNMPILNSQILAILLKHYIVLLLECMILNFLYGLILCLPCVPLLMRAKVNSVDILTLLHRVYTIHFILRCICFNADLGVIRPILPELLNGMSVMIQIHLFLNFLLAKNM